MTTATIDIEPLQRLSRDLKKAAITLSKQEVRYLVDQYYVLQENRKRADNQVRAFSESQEPHEILNWLAENMRRLENNIKSALDAYTDGDPIGAWAKSITGIGPVISAGLLAHIDMEPWTCFLHRQDGSEKACKESEPHDNPTCRKERIETVGHIWRFAGLDPTRTWEKKTKRPWNAELKVLCWKIGESFVKVSGNEADVYGKIWLARKALEQENNERFAFRDQAEAKLANFKIGKDTTAHEWYSKGMLPPAHVHARAKRYAVKLFLAHWHHVAYELQFGVAPPKPYAIERLGHAHYLKPPNWK